MEKGQEGAEKNKEKESLNKGRVCDKGKEGRGEVNKRKQRQERRQAEKPVKQKVNVSEC